MKRWFLFGLKWLVILLGAGFVYLLTRMWFMFFPCIYFPVPTEMHPPLPRYAMKRFGAPIKAGFSKRDITPGGFAWLGGYMPPHPAFVILDHLYVKALALQDSHGQRVVLVSCDLIGMLPTDVDAIKAQIASVSRDRIFISSTHTHSGPDIIGFWFGRREAYARSVRVQVVAAINEALANLTPSAIRYGHGDFNGATGSEENLPDPEVSVIQVLMKGESKSSSNQLVTLVNWACHPDIIEGFAISADFPYFLAERLKWRIGGETIYFSGAIGSVELLREETRDVQYLVRPLGEDLADRVVSIMRHPQRMRSADIAVGRMAVHAPFENARDIWRAVRLHLVPKLYDGRGEITTEVGKITLGPLTILTVPGELFPKIWHRVKAGHKNMMIFGLTDAEFGYILLPEDFDYDGVHAYHSGVSIGPTFGRKIHEGLQKLTGH